MKKYITKSLLCISLVLSWVFSFGQHELTVGTSVYYLPNNFNVSNDFQSSIAEKTITTLQLAYGIQLDYNYFWNRYSGLSCGVEYLSHNVAFNGEGIDQSIMVEGASPYTFTTTNKLRVSRSIGLSVNYTRRIWFRYDNLELSAGLGAYFNFYDALFGVFEDENNTSIIEPSDSQWDFPPERILPSIRAEVLYNWELTKKTSFSTGLPLQLIYNSDSQDGLKYGLKYLVGISVGLQYEL